MIVYRPQPCVFRIVELLSNTFLLQVLFDVQGTQMIYLRCECEFSERSLPDFQKGSHDECHQWVHIYLLVRTSLFHLRIIVEVRVVQSSVSVFCRLLCVLLLFLAWPLYCMSVFELRFLVTPSVFSSSSYVSFI